jgi:ribonuclease P protein component
MTSQRLGPHDRIRGSSGFRTVFEHGRVSSSGPLRVHVHAASQDRSRLGLAVSRRVGNAVRRNRMKRLLRVAFRSSRNAWESPLDVVVVVLPHEPQSLEQYQHHLAKAVGSAARWGEHTS